MKRALSRKNLWDATPQAVKAVLGRALSVFPPAVLLGSRFRRHFRFVEEAQWWPAERAREYQLKAVREICNLAYAQTPYYHRMFDAVGLRPNDLKSLDDLRALPTMDKHTVREHLDEMCAKPVTDPSVDYVSTGGSGGIPLYFYIGRERSYIEYAYLVSSWGRAGYRLGVPLAVLRGRVIRPDANGLYHEYDPLLRHHHYSNFHMTDENMQRYTEHMRGIGPCYLHMYPSSAVILARFLRRRGGKVPGNILGILAGSENVVADHRRYVEETFGVRYYSWYGHSEKLVLGAECEHSADYHVWPTYGYFELLDDEGKPVTQPGQRGEIVGTGFINKVVPFIRYRTGDYATYVADHCEACGRQHPILRDVEGRSPSGALVAADGSLIAMTAINVHDDTFTNVRQFQFYQDTPGEAVLRIVPATGFGDADAERIKRSLRPKLDGRISFVIQLVDALPLSPRGKAIYVDQKIPSLMTTDKEP
ncbi:MAG: phenylacetate--CoA ligase family protein [Planctomycetota bacterium]|nr:phenylacetate--CoA ligase family protein [Planctomycetota bacterium]